MYPGLLELSISNSVLCTLCDQGFIEDNKTKLMMANILAQDKTDDRIFLPEDTKVIKLSFGYL